MGAEACESCQPMPVTLRAVVQSFLMAVRAADRVIVPLQTAFLSFVSAPSLLWAVCAPEYGSGHRLLGSRGDPPSSRGIWWSSS